MAQYPRVPAIEAVFISVSVSRRVDQWRIRAPFRGFWRLFSAGLARREQIE
jgi:hypothetical protein